MPRRPALVTQADVARAIRGRMAALYTRAADRVRLSKGAIGKLERNGR